MQPVQLSQLKRLRLGIRATLILGMVASVAANILHARHNPISQTISAWPPLALLLTVELTSRVPMHKKNLAVIRVLATTVIAGIAAWVSYWHMQNVALHYGEANSSAYLLPISVDGLIVVASVCLVEISGRMRTLQDEAEAARLAALAPAAVAAPAQVVAASAPAAPVAGVPVTAAPMVAASAVAPAPVVIPAQAPAPVAASAIPAPATMAFDDDDDVEAELALVGSVAPVSPALPARPINGASRPSGVRPAVSAPARTMVTATTDTTPKPRRPVLETAELADAIEAMHPEIDESELARQLGITPNRLRQVRKEAAAARDRG